MAEKDNKVQRFKSRLAANRCAKHYGIYFFETLSSVVRYSRDVSTAYINNTLSVYEADDA